MSSTTLEPREKKKVRRAPPPKYHVIFNRGAQSVRACSVRLLQEVFHISQAQAMAHLKHTSAVGRSIVITDSREVAETKTDQANKAVAKHVHHNRHMEHVSFKFEKA